MAETLFGKLVSSYIPLPMCIVNRNGKIIRSNDHISQVFLYDGIENADFFALTGIKVSDLFEEVGKEYHHVLERNDRKFRLILNLEGEEQDGNLLVFFEDVTNLELLKDRYNGEKVCIAKINIDNYDDLIASTSAEKRMHVTAEIDELIRRWAAKAQGSINKLNSAQYIMYFPYACVEEMIESKFAVLDQVRDIETETDFPMSLSIGIGISGSSLVHTEEDAIAALDLALGRGGDQAVVKRGGQISYYGGKLQTVEKGNKGKSRVVAHALKQLIDQSRRVLIMGHANPDMDAFGAALGIYRLCIVQERDAYIVINEVNDSLQALYQQARETGTYQFIGHKKAEGLVDEDTLLILLDTHRPGYAEDPELLTLATHVVVIDHHRRAEDSVANATLSYIESYASSTAELVSEILQYGTPRKTLVKLEAEALLAGMTVDTNRFAVKTGVRTFEAAAWLRRAGADTTEVKRFFQTDMEAFKVRARSIAAAEFHENGIATSICDGWNENAQVLNSQVADELLNIRGVRASFVAGRTEKGRTVISARSLGELNVQVLMEQLGGGGHLTTAGAQVDCSPEEAIARVRELLAD